MALHQSNALRIKTPVILKLHSEAEHDLAPRLSTAPGVQHLRPLPGGALLWLPVPAEGLARPQEAVSRAQAGAGLGVGARAMICPHPRL